MTSAMLSMLREAAAGYGPPLPLARKLMSKHVPDEVLDGVPGRWATWQSPAVRDPSRTYHPYIPEPFTSRSLAVLGSAPILDFGDKDETRRDWGAVRHHLIYADGIALSDPIAKIFDERYLTGKFVPLDEALHYRRTRLSNLARFLTEADPLIEDGTIVFIPEPAYPIAYDQADLRRLAGSTEIVRAVQRLDPDGKKLAARAAEMQMGQPEGSMPFRPETYVMQAFNGILAEMVAGGEAGGGWDLYLPQREMQAVLNYVVKRAGKTLAGPTATARLNIRALADLLSVELPAVSEKIRSQDLVAIRKREPVFDEWRRGLHSALAVLDDALEADPHMTQAARRRLLQEYLGAAAAAARAEVGRSKALTELRSGAIETIIGTVATIGWHSQIGPVDLAGAVTDTALSALAVILVRWLTGSRSGPARRGLARHYEVFTSPRP